MATLATMRDGNVVLEDRNNTKNIQIRIKVASGKYERFSAGTADLDEAKLIAGGRYDDMTARIRFGMTPFEAKGKFRVLCEEYRRNLQEELDAGIGKPVWRTYISCIDKWIIPFFGDKDVHEIDEGVIAEFERHRKLTLGREIAKSTVNSHNVALRGVFRLASAKKLRSFYDFPRLSVKGKGRNTRVRPAFEESEIKPLLSFLATWHLQGTRAETRYKRQLLFCYVAILLHTGIRPGNEANSLEWRNVQEDYADPDGHRATRITMRLRKTDKDGNRPAVIAHRLINTYLYKLKLLTRHFEAGELLFVMWDGTPVKDLSEMFRSALREAGLLHNRSGKNRVLYSCRHTYATMKIREGVRYDVLAEQMDTGLPMFERHYSHLKVEMAVPELTGQVRRVPDYHQILLDAVPEELQEQLGTLVKTNVGRRTPGIEQAREILTRIRKRQGERLEEIRRSRVSDADKVSGEEGALD